MATSAFKSTSRRGAAEPPSPSRRRSHSVSAVNRKTHLQLDDTISTEFSNSRDNPLFWTASSSLSSPRDKEKCAKTSEIGSNSSKQLNSSTRRSGRNSVGSCDSANEVRGRSITRNGGTKKGIGRSLSRVPAYESEKEQDVVTSTGARSRTETKQIGNGVNRSNSVRGRIDTRGGRAEEARIRRFQNQAKEWSEDDSTCSLQISNFEDEISIGDLSEAEEKTIKAVCEDLTPSRDQWADGMPPSGIYESARSEVFQRNNVHTAPATATNIADIPVDLVNLGDMELISDIRKEYATKLEESEERARRLRTDLAVEEHRGHELGRILKEILPDPKTSIVQKPRRGRRTSNERKRMSRRLTEEAMAYFDECVSLSTFDSSDFSAPEDPTFSSSGATMHVGATSLVKRSPTILRGYDQENTLHQKQVQLHHSYEDPRTIIKNNNTAGTGISYNFSFSSQQPKKAEPHEDLVGSYIKNFERDIVKDTNPDCRRSYYDAEEYSAHDHVENMLIDKVLYRNRIDSGRLLLCSGAISFLPFSSVL